MSGPRRSAHLEPPDHEPRHAIGGGMDNDCKGILMLDLIEPALNTTPTPLLRAKLAAGTVAFAVFAGATIGQPSSTMLTAQAGGPAQHHVAVQLVAEISDTSATVGVADSNLYNLSQDELVDRLNDMKSLGVTDLRIAVPWMYIQPTSATSYDWSKMDSVVDTASSMGFSITGAISGNPKWDGTPLAGAPNPTAYATFASAVASRYGTKSGAYEVWNEPNGVVSFAPVSAAKYPEVPKAAYTAIKAANPDAINFYVNAFGARRVVLPRVLSVPEIAAITREVACETEVFVFGGLCVMEEGRCSLSSYATGKSPNMDGVCSPAAQVRFEEQRDGAMVSRLGTHAIDCFASEDKAGYPTICKGRYRAAVICPGTGSASTPPPCCRRCARLASRR